jgi:hypothetical protein
LSSDGDGMVVCEMELKLRFWLAGICVRREESCGFDLGFGDG